MWQCAGGARRECVRITSGRGGCVRGVDRRMGMRNLLIMLALLAFIGCDQRVERSEINDLTDMCKEHGGLSYIDLNVRAKALCKDGTSVRIGVKR